MKPNPKMKYLHVFFLLSILLFSQSVIQAQAQTAPPSSQDLALNHIAVYVHELTRSTAFYENILMLRRIDEPFNDGKHTWFTIGAAGQLHLIEGAEANVKRNKNDHLCFSVASIEDFIKNLERHGVEYTNWPGTAKSPTVRPDGIKQIYFQDPDGHWIEINNDVRRH